MRYGSDDDASSDGDVRALPGRPTVAGVSSWKLRKSSVSMNRCKRFTSSIDLISVYAGRKMNLGITGDGWRGVGRERRWRCEQAGGHAGEACIFALRAATERGHEPPERRVLIECPRPGPPTLLLTVPCLPMATKAVPVTPPHSTQASEFRGSPGTTYEAGRTHAPDQRNQKSTSGAWGPGRRF